MIGRNTQWRQGNLLTDEDAHTLKLIESRAADKRVVVISHDCDLPNDTEAFVEVIVGSQIPASDPMLANARNPRRLHIRFTSRNGEALYVELRHADRRQVSKAEFASLESADIHFALSDDEKRTLKQWLAARYSRPAFPNAFERRLDNAGKKSVKQRIDKITEPAAQYLLGLFFDLGEERAVELPDGVPYFLSISLVYDATKGGQAAREAADKVAEELRTLFVKAYGTANVATEIALEECVAVADIKMTLADIRKVDQWRLEYISLREKKPAGEFFAAGE
jgi:hypothetical protein